MRVTNLPPEAADGDIQKLFRRFNPKRVSVPMSRDNQSENRGFAFIDFFDKKDAEEALNAIDRHHYGYTVLSVEWAQPK